MWRPSQYGLLRPEDLIYEKILPPGSAWTATSNDWRYREKVSGGSVYFRAHGGKPRFSARGSLAVLPAPDSGTSYFDTMPYFGIMNSAGYCFVNPAGEARTNTPTRYVAGKRGLGD